MWADAVKRANSLDTDKVSAALSGGTYDTAIGKLTFDGKGDVKNPEYVWYVWHNGKYAEQD